MNAIYDYYRALLSEIYTPHEVGMLYRLAVEKICAIKKEDTYFCKDNNFTEKQTTQLKTIAKRLAKNEPIEYILGETAFFGFTLKVTPDVLIPRPETSELVEWVIQENKDKEGLRILDLCTGSGCIAIALKKHLKNSTVWAVDISQEALLVAQENAQNLDAEIHFVKADFLKDQSWREKSYDIIVSNPPYISQKEKKDMHANVLDYEPHLALFPEGDNPLVFYDKIAHFGTYYNAIIYTEINQYLSQETEQCFKSREYSTLLKKDIFGNKRFIRAARMAHTVTSCIF